MQKKATNWIDTSSNKLNVHTDISRRITLNYFNVFLIVWAKLIIELDWRRLARNSYYYVWSIALYYRQLSYDSTNVRKLAHRFNETQTKWIRVSKTTNNELKEIAELRTQSTHTHTHTKNKGCIYSVSCIKIDIIIEKNRCCIVGLFRFTTRSSFQCLSKCYQWHYTCFLEAQFCLISNQDNLYMKIWSLQKL